MATDNLPTKLYFWNDENASNLASHSASWHKSCHLKFSSSELTKVTEKNMRNAVVSGGGKPMKCQ